MADIVTIVGTRDCNFTDDSGRLVDGISYFYLADANNVMGQMSSKIFVSRNRLASLSYVPVIGDVVEIIYNRYGKLTRFQKVGK